MKVAIAAALLTLPMGLAVAGDVVIIGAPAYTCRGESAVLADEAVWAGTQGRDVVVAYASTVDQLYTYGGDDLICVHGDPGDVSAGIYVDSGGGNDTVVTYSGCNQIVSGTGNDIIYLNGYVESVQAGADNDHVWGLGADQVVADGGPGTDMLQGSSGSDMLAGGLDDDLIIGAAGNDSLSGNGGNDTIQGGADSDTLAGNDGTDSCSDAATSMFSGCEHVTYTGPGGITT